MEIEEKQAEVIDHFVKQASAQKGSALGSVVVEATSHPSLFAFSEILAVPTVAEVRDCSIFDLRNQNHSQLSNFLFVYIVY